MLEITLRPTLLAYQNTVTLDDVVVILDVEYHQRTDDWWISFYDEQGEPILLGRRVVGRWPLTVGTIDTRLPQGAWMVLQVGDIPQAVAGIVRDMPRAGELGRSWRMLYYTIEDLTADSGDPDLLEPRAIIVQGGP